MKVVVEIECDEFNADALANEVEQVLELEFGYTDDDMIVAIEY